MAEQNEQRRLAAIFSADMVGYSRLMEADERGTIARQKAHRAELIDPKIAEHHGRIVKTTGDGLLVEFASVVDAVECAMLIQQAMVAREEGVAEDRLIQYRIGINLGDIVIEGDDIFGDGVNIAARLESLAEPGGVCISRATRDQIRDKLEYPLDDLGEIEVKNIVRPVRVFRVLSDPNAVAKFARRTMATRWLKRLVATAVAILIMAGGVAIVWLQPWKSEANYPASSLSANASIAVLPFSNRSRDPGQEYLSDGITNDLITDLSKFGDLFVIASSSVFTYKGKAVKMQEVSRDLGVRYVVEGSVQKLGERIRINVQLIDATSGKHLWADRYDEAATDLFDLQDRITKHIVRTLAVKITNIEEKRVFAKPTRDLKAYDYVLRGWRLLSIQKREENFEARNMFRNAIARDQGYASAYAGLGRTFQEAVRYGWTGSPQAAMARAYELAQKGIAIDNDNVAAHRLAAAVYLTRRQHDLALVETERAIALNPNDPANHALQGAVLLYFGRPDGAILSYETALRFDPLMGPSWLTGLGLAYYLKDRYEDAAKVLKRGLAINPDFLYGQTVLAAVYGQWGRREKATRAAQDVRRLNPFFSTDDIGGLFREPADKARFADGLRKAGLK